MVDVDEHNGCLQIIPGSHKQGLRPPRRDENGRLVPIEDVESWGNVQNVRMKVGDVLVFGNLTFHRSLENTSEDIRWSIDLRYSPTGSPPGMVTSKNGLALSPVVSRQPRNGRIVENVGSQRELAPTSDTRWEH